MEKALAESMQQTGHAQAMGFEESRECDIGYPVCALEKLQQIGFRRFAGTRATRSFEVNQTNSTVRWVNENMGRIQGTMLPVTQMQAQQLSASIAQRGQQCRPVGGDVLKVRQCR